MKLFFKIVNFLMRRSTTQWNKNGITRRIYRWCYRAVVEWPAFLQLAFKPELYPEGNTYPYREREVKHLSGWTTMLELAPWEEHDDKENYNLITDHWRFVIKRSTSYVAWKYFEATGKVFQTLPEHGHANDAKNWQKLMALNKIPPIEGDFAQYIRENGNKRHHFIGILPSHGEFGQLYWFESLADDGICVSTYENFLYQLFILDNIHEIIWYKVD